MRVHLVPSSSERERARERDREHLIQFDVKVCCITKTAGKWHWRKSQHTVYRLHSPNYTGYALCSLLSPTKCFQDLLKIADQQAPNILRCGLKWLTKKYVTRCWVFYNGASNSKPLWNGKLTEMPSSPLLLTVCGFVRCFSFPKLQCDIVEHNALFPITTFISVF